MTRRSVVFGRLYAASAAAAAAAVLAGLASGTPTRASSSSDAGTSRHPALAPAGLDVVEPSWSPRGAALVFALDGRDRDVMELASIRLGSRRPRLRLLTHGAGMRRAFNPRWSPDGKTIAFGAANEATGKGDLYVMSVDGTRLRLLAQATREPAWSPDGRVVAGWVEDYGGSTQLAFVTAATGHVRRLRLRRNYYARYPFWSPDGRRIGFVANGGNGPDYVVDADGGRPRVLLRGAPSAGVLSHDWRKIAYAGRDGCLYVYDRASRRSHRLTRHGRAQLDASPAWSRRDRWIAFSRSRRDGTHSSLYVVRTNGTGLREVVAAGP